MNDIYQQIVQFVQDQVANNELFKGGLILGIGAALLAYARSWPKTIWGWIVYHSTVEIDIPEGSEAFKWVDRWLSQHHYSEKRARRLTASSTRRGNESIPHVVPAPGRHYMFEGGRFVITRRIRQALETANHSGKAYTESISLRVIGRSRTPALKILDKAFSMADKPKDDVAINYCDDYGGWFKLSEKRPRPISSIVLPGDLRDKIVDDARQFLGRQDYYAKLGVPWRRGYLFYGPPGNGKSSTVFALASILKMEISYLNLKDVTDTTLMKGLADIPSNSILVIEDIDCLFGSEDTRETKVAISYAALINSLDGVTSPDGLILIMTTNKREKLDSALIRPGRVDMEIKFKDATLAQAVELFNLFYPGAETVEFTRAYDALAQPMSMAALQGHFLISETPEKALTIGNRNGP
jgi:chaperone BCS1